MICHKTSPNTFNIIVLCRDGCSCVSCIVPLCDCCTKCSPTLFMNLTNILGLKWGTLSGSITRCLKDAGLWGQYRLRYWGIKKGGSIQACFCALYCVIYSVHIWHMPITDIFVVLFIDCIEYPCCKMFSNSRRLFWHKYLLYLKRMS